MILSTTTTTKKLILWSIKNLHFIPARSLNVWFYFLNYDVYQTKIAIFSWKNMFLCMLCFWWWSWIETFLFMWMLLGRNIKRICLYHLTKHTKLPTYIVIARIKKFNACVSVSAWILSIYPHNTIYTEI